MKRETAVKKLVSAVAMSLALGGCITERSSTLQGVPVKPQSQQQNQKQSAAAKPAETGAKAELPPGPIATPGNRPTLATNVAVEVLPVGMLGYDGQALPVVSPDGRFLAMQEGEPPTWPTILAESGAQEALGVRIVIYAIDKPPAKRLASSSIPGGAMLGRSADGTGFLIEHARPDGSRWIGKVTWLGGEVSWLVRSADVNAHGVLTAQGDLVFTRRATNSGAAVLVMRSQQGEESIKDPMGGTYAYPIAVAGGEMVYAFHTSKSGLDLEAIRIDRHDPSSPRLADTRQSWRISGDTDVMLAQQMASTAPAPIRIPTGEPVGDADILTCFEPRRCRVCRFNWHTGAIEPLADDSMVAAMGPDVSGDSYFCAAPKGLVFLPRPKDGWPGSWNGEAPAARVLPQPYVATRLDTKPITYLLVGPVRDSKDRLEIVKMAIGK
ncbi:MAG: hypothetical protein JSR77_03055 [Planctomycetes bacterium]|nr:hypothetical protein [Planctomycetota bacterium]